MGRWVVAVFAVLAALWLVPAQGRALGFEVSGSREGQSLNVLVEYDGEYGRVSACVFKVTFDQERMDFTGSREANGGYLVSSVEGNMVQVIYSSRTDNDGLESVSFEFKARRGADTGAASILVQVEQVAAQKDVPEIPPVSVEYQGEPAASSEAKLLTLYPDSGELEPEFSPDTTHYEVSVPYSVTEMNFGLSASPGARVSVNRRKLGSGGSDTLFRLTVTAEDGMTKGIYTVNVHRGEYAAPTPKPTATPAPDKTPKPDPTPKAAKASGSAATPKAAKTPKPSSTPGPSAAPKKAKTPAPDAALAEGKTPKPSDSPAETPLMEVVVVEKEGAGVFDRLSALGCFFIAIFGLAALGTSLYERVNRRREERLNGKRK